MKKSFIVLPALLLLLAACTPVDPSSSVPSSSEEETSSSSEEISSSGEETSSTGGETSSSSEESSSSSEPALVPLKSTITSTNLLGWEGTNISYGDGTDIEIDGVKYDYVELGEYGSGIQMRHKVKDGRPASELFNTTTIEGGEIESIVLNYNGDKYTDYAPTAELEYWAGATTQAAAVTGSGTIFTDTVLGTNSYTIEFAAGVKYFKLLKAIVGENNHSVYLNSIEVNWLVPAVA